MGVPRPDERPLRRELRPLAAAPAGIRLVVGFAPGGAGPTLGWGAMPGAGAARLSSSERSTCISPACLREAPAARGSG